MAKTSRQRVHPLKLLVLQAQWSRRFEALVCAEVWDDLRAELLTLTVDGFPAGDTPVELEAGRRLRALVPHRAAYREIPDAAAWKRIAEAAGFTFTAGRPLDNEARDFGLWLRTMATKANGVQTTQQPATRKREPRPSKNAALCEAVAKWRENSVKWEALPRLVQQQFGEEKSVDAIKKAFRRWKASQQ
jgi:hypothetical protein